MSHFISVVSLLSSMWAEALQGESGPSAAPEISAGEKVAIENIAQLIARYHVSKKQLDDEISEQVLVEFVSCLDPQRRYFLASDLSEFDLQSHHLDDAIKQCDVAVFREIYRRYLLRSGQLDQDVDKTLDDLSKTSAASLKALEKTSANAIAITGKIVNRKLAGIISTWPASEAQQQRRWKRQIAKELKNLQNEGLDRGEAVKRISGRLHQLQKNRIELTGDDLGTAIINSVARAYDPHSSYLDERATEDFKISMNLSLGGIGIVLGDSAGYPTVKKLISGGPAASAGLRQGDTILGVGEAGAAMKLTGDWKASDVSPLIRGEAGTKLQMLIGRGETQFMLNFERRQIHLMDAGVTGQIVDKRNGTGLIHLPSFYESGSGEKRSCSADLKNEVERLKGLGMKSLVLDLRGNGGGVLDEAVKVAGLFIDHGPVVQIRYRNNQDTVILSDDDKGKVWDGPLTLLVDGGTASAAEIVAAAIQDYQRGLIIGEPTYGKGTVQKMLSLEQARNPLTLGKIGGALAVTVGQIYRVNGSSTQVRGITPDLPLSQKNEEKSSELKEAELPNHLGWAAIAAAHVDREARPACAVTEARQLIALARQSSAHSEDPVLGMAMVLMSGGKATITGAEIASKSEPQRPLIDLGRRTLGSDK